MHVGVYKLREQERNVLGVFSHRAGSPFLKHGVKQDLIKLHFPSSDQSYTMMTWRHRCKSSSLARVTMQYDLIVGVSRARINLKREQDCKKCLLFSPRSCHHQKWHRSNDQIQFVTSISQETKQCLADGQKQPTTLLLSHSVTFAVVGGYVKCKAEEQEKGKDDTGTILIENTERKWRKQNANSIPTLFFFSFLGQGYAEPSTATEMPKTCQISRRRTKAKSKNKKILRVKEGNFTVTIIRLGINISRGSSTIIGGMAWSRSGKNFTKKKSASQNRSGLRVAGRKIFSILLSNQYPLIVSRRTQRKALMKFSDRMCLHASTKKKRSEALRRWFLWEGGWGLRRA